jgi:hypothetical protein
MNRRSTTSILKNYFISWWIIIPCVLLFVYVAIRACALSLTWDEANTFFEYVRNPHWLPDGYNYMSANNHLLNTWLMKCSVFLFGESEFALRLPNVLAGGFYFFTVALLAKKLAEKHWHSLVIFLLLCLNPFVLDFFSVARGYGISLALLMTGILQITKYILEKQELRYGIYAQLFFATAVFANLTLIHVLLAISFLLILNRFIFHRKENSKRAILFLTLIPIVCLLLLLPYIKHLNSAGALFYGEEARSLADTFLSLSKSSAYGVRYSIFLVPVATVLVSAIPLISVIHVMRNSITVMKNGQGRWLVFITLTLFFTIAGPMLQHLLLKTNFLSGRTALFYIPLIALNFIGVLVLCPPRLKNILLLFAGIFSLTHFYFSFNTHFTYDWKEQADVKDAMLALKDKNIPVAKNCFADMLSTNLPYEKQINYYRMRLDMKNYSHAGRKENFPACSIYYLNSEEYDLVTKKNRSRKENINDYWISRTKLFYFPGERGRVNELIQVKEVWQDFEHEDLYAELKTDTIYFGEQGTFANAQHPYSISVPIEVPGSVKGEIVATMNCRLYYYTRNTSAVLVFGFDNGSAETWEAMHITELPEKPHTWSITSWTRPVPAGTKKVRVYLWNTDEIPVLMDNVTVRLLATPQGQ